MPDTPQGQFLQRVSVAETKLTSIEKQVDRLEASFEGFEASMKKSIDDFEVRFLAEIKEIRDVLTKAIEANDNRDRATELTVARHEFVLKCLGTLLVGFVIAVSPVLVSHYVDSGSATTPSHAHTS